MNFDNVPDSMITKEPTAGMYHYDDFGRLCYIPETYQRDDETGKVMDAIDDDVNIILEFENDRITAAKIAWVKVYAEDGAMWIDGLIVLALPPMLEIVNSFGPIERLLIAVKGTHQAIMFTEPELLEGYVHNEMAAIPFQASDDPTLARQEEIEDNGNQES